MMSTNAQDRHEQMTNDSLHAVKEIMAGQETLLKNAGISQVRFLKFIKGDNDAIEIDISKLFELFQAFRLAIEFYDDEIEELDDFYCEYIADIGSNILQKQLDGLKAVILDNTRALFIKLGKRQIIEENKEKREIRHLIDRVTKPVHAIAEKVFGWPWKKQLREEDAQLNVDYKKQEQDDNPDDTSTGGAKPSTTP